MRHIYPAYELDRLHTSYRSKYRELMNRIKELKLENPDEEEPEQKDELCIQMSTELDELDNVIDEEHYRVIGEYNELFKTHYITIEELQTMFDLDRLYIERHILPNVSSVYLNRFVRKYIKTSHKNGTECILDKVIRHCDIDYEKKVFLNKNDLEKWFFEHCTSNDMLITEPLVKYFLQDRKKAVMHSTETIKKMYGLKYGMQLQRLGLNRIYVKAVEGKQPLSRIPSNEIMSFISSSS